MSVDLVATMPRPVALDVLVAAAREAMADLLCLPAAPVMTVFADRRYDQGHRTDPGRRLSAADLAAQLVGGPVPAPRARRPSSRHFKFEVGETGDGAHLMVADFSELPGIGAPGDEVEAVFSPTRTCAGVVVASALALAAARHSDGIFIDAEIRMLDPMEIVPEIVITRTALAERGTDFATQCERYMRQFGRLNGWPRDVSLAG